jgi:hypothetical protein
MMLRWKTIKNYKEIAMVEEKEEEEEEEEE